MNKKFRLAAILILVAITISLYVPVVWGDPDYPNAVGYISDNVTAIQARIETADPQIRDGYWSCVRIIGSTPFEERVELGWIKLGWRFPDPGPGIYGFTQSKVAGQLPTMDTWGRQYPMETHTYQIKRKGGGTGRWKYYIDGIQVDTRYAGFDVAKEVGSGGEVHSDQNAMGVSGCLDNQWRDLNKVWHYYMYTYTDVDYPYQLVNLPRPYSWQVYGNNYP
jgi:hypothetical protein